MNKLTYNTLWDLLDNPESRTVIATVGSDGIPEIAEATVVHQTEPDRLYYLEWLEKSQTNINLTTSIWFDRIVKLLVFNGDDIVKVKAVVAKNHISGQLFFNYYNEALKSKPTFDLTGVWELEITGIESVNPADEVERHRAAHPGMIHLDRIAK
ncbi:MAG: hypothetical protein GXY18_04060 [Methanomicrobiales archaeon]|nr:hypothetical protein [Methanomicrobiales archaeon]